MRIELKGIDSKIILDDDDYDVPGFLDMNGEAVHINDLYPAVMAFEEKYRREIKQ